MLKTLWVTKGLLMNDNNPGARPELALLICCARAWREPERAVQIRALLREDLDWSDLLQTASAHGVLPLVYRSLHNTCPMEVPPAVLEEMRTQFRDNALRNLFLTSELLQLLKQFDANGISAIPFKGPALSVAVFGDLSLRQFADLDILVRARDVGRANEVLLAQGYRQTEDRLHCEQHFLRDDVQVEVDLHWGIHRNWSGSLNSEQWWRRLVPLSLAGVPTRSLAPEDALLLLCVNATKEYWQLALHQVCSIAELTRACPALDWTKVVEQARRLRCERMLWAGLVLARDLLDAAVPQAVWEAQRDVPKVHQLVAQLRAHLFSEHGKNPPYLQMHMWHLRLMDCLWDRFLYCWPLAVKPGERDQAVLPLPLFLSFFYYPFRPIRLLFTRGRISWSFVKQLLGF